MALSKSELYQAFQEAASAEFDDVPHDDTQISHTLSSRFQDKMNLLIIDFFSSFNLKNEVPLETPRD